jgi:hypothetical protein
MANPCAGVPSNAWCSSSGSSLGRTARHDAHLTAQRVVATSAYRRTGA